jgi:hypothetical protein
MTPLERRAQVVEEYRQLIGLPTLPGVTSEAGVVLDWGTLTAALSGELVDLRERSATVSLLAPGLVQGRWRWKRGDLRFDLEATVSGRGPHAAREHLLWEATNVSRYPIPFERVTSGPGDLAVIGTRRPPDIIIWVYRNVSLLLHTDQTHQTGVEALAHLIQRVMEGHVVARLAAYLPRPESVEVSPQRIRVGETTTATIRGTFPPSVFSEIGSTGPTLRAEADSPQAVTFRAAAPGRADIEVMIADENTLLSPFYEFHVDVLPAEGTLDPAPSRR